MKLKYAIFIAILIAFAADASAEIVQHLDAEDTASILADDFGVADWTDLSGMFNDATFERGNVLFPGTFTFFDGDDAPEFGNDGPSNLRLFDSESSDLYFNVGVDSSFGMLIVLRVNSSESNDIWNDLIGNNTASVNKDSVCAGIKAPATFRPGSRTKPNPSSWCRATG